MLAKDKETVKKHKAYARKLIKEIIAEHDFKITKRIKFGPRYFVAEGLYENKRALFKICLYPQSYDHLTNEKFCREILFLNIMENRYARAIVDPWLQVVKRPEEQIELIPITENLFLRPDFHDTRLSVTSPVCLEPSVDPGYLMNNTETVKVRKDDIFVFVINLKQALHKFRKNIACPPTENTQRKCIDSYSHGQ